MAELTNNILLTIKSSMDLQNHYCG